MQERLNQGKIDDAKAHAHLKDTPYSEFTGLRRAFIPAILAAATLSAGCQVDEELPVDTDTDEEAAGFQYQDDVPSSFDYDTDDLEGDDDEDGLTNAEEAAYGTDPNDPNTDLDRLTDFEEVQTLLDADPSNDRDPRACDAELIHLTGTPGTDNYYPVFADDFVPTEWGPQGGFHFYHGYQSWCKDSTNSAIAYVTNAEGDVVMGNDSYPTTFFNMLQFPSFCEQVNDAELICSGWRIMYQTHLIPNDFQAYTNDPRIFGESNDYTLHLQYVTTGKSANEFDLLGDPYVSEPFHLEEEAPLFP